MKFAVVKKALARLLLVTAFVIALDGVGYCLQAVTKHLDGGQAPEVVFDDNELAKGFGYVVVAHFKALPFLDFKSIVPQKWDFVKLIFRVLKSRSSKMKLYFLLGTGI